MDLGAFQRVEANLALEYANHYALLKITKYLEVSCNGVWKITIVPTAQFLNGITLQQLNITEH